ncbi:unnamed protein product (macronuclear) [Paramecium tetraurelia]|uniref:Protein kinase domain-containing protein n=1 Tax=Paramecium tetraurelia TaxID=5888 RepID=A0DRW3_PARTE|nr:uncharacterized protein GSPATT00019484001 [Paramecium tetraurelia]CAK85780.1 unnamed protein product [Paramecium tetraurelia]|eukprot:XP_001453177.1 hypothetical protein (macronuclear) [Paramecium tetraurelia strain d4-2]
MGPSLRIVKDAHQQEWIVVQLAHIFNIYHKNIKHFSNKSSYQCLITHLLHYRVMLACGLLRDNTFSKFMIKFVAPKDIYLNISLFKYFQSLLFNILKMLKSQLKSSVTSPSVLLYFLQLILSCFFACAIAVDTFSGCYLNSILTNQNFDNAI